MKRPRLADNVRLFPVYQDETPFGSVISSAADERLRARCAPVLSALRAKSQEIAQVSDALRATLLRKDVLGELYQQPGVLREDCLYPAPEQVRPTGLSVQLLGGTHTADIPLSQRQIGNLAPFIGALSRGDALPKDRDAQELYDALAAAGP